MVHELLTEQRQGRTRPSKNIFSSYERLVPVVSRSHYAGEIWKRSFISTVRPNVHANPLRRRSFPKTLFKQEYENVGYSFCVDGKPFKNGAFQKRWRHDNDVISLTEFSPVTSPKWSMIVAFSNFSGVLQTENIWCVFRVKTPFSNFVGVVWMGPQFRMQ